MERYLLKKFFYASLMTLTIPVPVFALGLGNMKVKSALDQPFKAEIKLLDAASVDITSIKVHMADPANAEEVGVEPVAAWNFLRFKIDKNSKGRWVVNISSQEPIVDPYLEIVVDLVWPSGQLFKAYTVLLDPPGYQINVSKVQNGRTSYRKKTTYPKEPGVIEKEVVTTVHPNPDTNSQEKDRASYGPTVAKENVWQIAQRYKTSAETLPQVVLAIVGANPEDFTGGNLNGMKTGVYLVIPASKEILQVPADLAMEEVMVHDIAWNDKVSINHVLTPPYIGSQMVKPSAEVQESFIPSIAKSFTQTIPLENSAITQTSLLVPVSQTPPAQANKPTSDADELTKAQIAITTAAVESMRESHALLMEQLRLVQEQNRKLQNLLDKKQNQLETLQVQVQALTKERRAVAGQGSSAKEDSSSSVWWYLLLLLIAAVGGGGTYWYFWFRERVEEINKPDPEPATVVEDTPPKLIQEPEKVVEEPKPEITLEPQEESTPEQVDEPIVEQEQELIIEPEDESVEESIDDSVSTLIEETADEPEKPVVKEPEEEASEHILEFEPGLHELIKEPEENADTLPYDTLLSLAKKYIEDGNFDSARTSLKEVLEKGSEEQQVEARRLLDEMDTL